VTIRGCDCRTTIAQQSAFFNGVGDYVTTRYEARGHMSNEVKTRAATCAGYHGKNPSLGKLQKRLNC